MKHFQFLTKNLRSKASFLSTFKSPLYQRFGLLLTLFFLLINCGRQHTTSPHIKNIEDYYLNGEYAKALDLARDRTIKSDDKDRLLYLIESGSIMHTMRDWEKSNLAFLEANEIAENISQRISKKIQSFLINDSKDDYQAESFERVLIKFYIALNYIMLEQPGRAMNFFKQLNIELSDIRDMESGYRINHAARVLYAFLAEADNSFNEARVQYNNMVHSKQYLNQARANLYHLALKEGDLGDQKKYRSYAQHLAVLDNDLQPVPIGEVSSHLEEGDRFGQLGSLVVIHESGLAPYKASRGKIGQDKTFKLFLKGGIYTALASKNYTGLNFSLILATMQGAQNPIPIYKERTQKNKKVIMNIKLNHQNTYPTEIYDDYKKMAFKNFNDRYPDYVKRNVASIAVKVITVLVASKIISGSGKNEQPLLGMLSSLVGGSIVASTIAPDLRAWNLTYDNLQIRRILMPPGEYDFALDHPAVTQVSKYPNKIKINPQRPTFIVIRSF